MEADVPQGINFLPYSRRTRSNMGTACGAASVNTKISLAKSKAVDNAIRSVLSKYNSTLFTTFYRVLCLMAHDQRRQWHIMYTHTHLNV